MSEKLYNNIKLPKNWPPISNSLSSPIPQRIPYLEKTPEVINIDVGRQLFVDDFLIEDICDRMARVYHQPVKYPGNPVFFAQTEEELNNKSLPGVAAKSGGVWFDTDEQIFKMWYMASYLGSACYATSKDGIHWHRPNLDVVTGTNLVLPRSVIPDSGSVVIDYETDNKEERYKCLLREPNSPDYCGDDIGGILFTSADGIHWNKSHKTGVMGDRSTMFYNPFRKKWVQSIRHCYPKNGGRIRLYCEHDNFFESGNWEKLTDNIPWLRADCFDEDQAINSELYNFDAIAYESIMLGFHQILKGPPNSIGEASGMPKLTELTLGYSRDGFHFHRPNRKAFIGARREAGSWEYGYVESSAGMCHIVGDELWFYYTAYAGDSDRTNTNNWQTNGTYANSAVGLAKLRRDGFASMQAHFKNACLLTKPLEFTGNHLFINANTSGDCLKVEVQDINYQTIDGFSFEDCIGFYGNSTAAQIQWKNADLKSLIGKPVRFKFQMNRGEIYSFWVTPDNNGKSNGYVAAGGPGFTGSIDC